MRTLCESLLLLFMATDKVTKVKDDMDDILDGYGTAVIADDHACAISLGWDRILSLRRSNFCSMVQLMTLNI